MKVVEMKRCRKCGGIPVWMQSSIGSGIGCENAQCDDKIVVAPTFLEALKEWNRMQEEGEGKE